MGSTHFFACIVIIVLFIPKEEKEMRGGRPINQSIARGYESFFFLEICNLRPFFCSPHNRKTWVGGKEIRNARSGFGSSQLPKMSLEGK